MKKRLFITFVLAAVLIFSTFVGIQLQRPNEAQAQNTPCYGLQGGAKWVAASGCEYEFRSGSTLDVQSGANVTWTPNLTFSGNVTVEGTITLDDVAFSGPIKFGSTANVSNNTLIAHGIGTTPTVITLTPLEAGAFTQTVSLSATNATSFTVRLSAGAATPTVYWMAGK